MVLTKEELYDRIKAKYGDSDEDLKDIEDLTDTIEEMSKKEIDQDLVTFLIESNNIYINNLLINAQEVKKEDL